MRLKRFVVEATREYRLRRRRDTRAIQDRQMVAIIGAGPAGLTAAADLARAGFRPVVFERSGTPGGLLGNAIPRYRLPYPVVREDIDDILALGVELKTGTEVGRDVMLADMLGQGFAAVVVATGLSESRTLAIPGIDSRGVFLALPFLRTVQSSRPIELRKRVVVIGGGNVALDVARTARRLGAQRVVAVCLESRQEMPAWPWEVKEAEEEGVEILNSWGPAAVFSEGGQVRGLVLKRCTAVFDAEGRFSPRFDEAQTATVVADSVIIAIGQRGELACLEGSGVEVGRDGRVQWDPQTLSASRRGVFACGEVVTGPGSAVEAVFDGHRAARAVAHYLETGELLRQTPMELPHIGELPEEVARKVKVLSPSAVEVLAPERRVQGFSEIERGFTEAEALAEASRCLACTTGAIVDEARCTGCLTCVRICPFGVATVEETAVMPQEKCQACGLCAAQCPAAAIALKRFGTNQMKPMLKDALEALGRQGRSCPLLVSYCCLFEVSSREFIRRAQQDLPAGGTVPIMVPCVARLSVTDMLSPFELGADGLAIIACGEGTCLYPTAEQRLLQRIRRAKSVLTEIGLEADRIDFWETRGQAEVSWTAFWEASRRRLGLMQTAERSKVDDRR